MTGSHALLCSPASQHTAQRPACTCCIGCSAPPCLEGSRRGEAAPGITALAKGCCIIACSAQAQQGSLHQCAGSRQHAPAGSTAGTAPCMLHARTQTRPPTCIHAAAMCAAQRGQRLQVSLGGLLEAAEAGGHMGHSRCGLWGAGTAHSTPSGGSNTRQQASVLCSVVKHMVLGHGPLLCPCSAVPLLCLCHAALPASNQHPCLAWESACQAPTCDSRVQAWLALLRCPA